MKRPPPVVAGNTRAIVHSARHALARVFVIGAALAGCRAQPPAPPSMPSPGVENGMSVEWLREFERASRAASDFTNEWAGDGAFGADPYRVVSAGDGRWLGLLRGSSALVVIDETLQERARVDTPRRPVALGLAGGGAVLVAGSLEGSIRRYQYGPELTPMPPIEVPGVGSWRALAAGPGDSMYALSEYSLDLYLIEGASSSEPGVTAFSGLGHGPHALAYARGYVVVNCLLDHQLVVIPVDDRGRPRRASGGSLSPEVVRIQHDGPFWGLAITGTDDGLLIAATGIEDHPLDRSSGSFGYIDSFLYLYQVSGDGKATRRLALNTSEHDVVTPKALTVGTRGGGVRVHVSSYASAAALTLELDAALRVQRLVRRVVPPGSAALVEIGDERVLAANPLLDAWTLQHPEGFDLEPVHEPHDDRTPYQKLGEALLYTTLMAPANRATGALSRFTCEACHFEGYVDGRTHHTGRGDVRATTKPLFGLYNNRPYFSRALDRDLTQMVHNEFRVAGANSGLAPELVLVRREPWLARLGVEPPVRSGQLRFALMLHLMRASHEPNPLARGRRAFDVDEARGARVFQSSCESCHQARLDTSDADSRVPFERWASLILSDAGPIVWGSNVYAKTGIEPYVHERGARVPSLRRLGRKFPYFTNGSAHDVSEVLERVRRSPAFSHAAAGEGALTLDEQRALQAFLRLL